MPSTPLVAFYCDAGNGRGFGNVYRTVSLAREFGAKGWRVKVAVQTIDQIPAIPFIAPDLRIVPMSEGSSLLDVVREQPDVLVFDSREINQDRMDSLHRHSSHRLAAHLSDAGFALDGIDLVVDTDLLATQPADTRRVLSGKGYSIIRPDVCGLRRPIAPSQSPVRKLGVLFGAEDPGSLTELLLDEGLLEIADVDTTVFCGPGFSEPRIAAIKKRGASVASRKPDQYAGQLAELDAVITLGGQSALEAACLGKVNFVVRWSWMADYAVELSRTGIAIDLSTPQRAIGRLTRILEGDAQAMGNSSLNGWSGIDGKGASRICDKVVSMLKPRCQTGKQE